MKNDVLTLAAAVFVVGILLSNVSFSEVFKSTPPPPAELQQGFALQANE